MEMVRAFVGCLLDIGATRRVVDLSKSLRRAAEAAGWKAAWVPPPNLHLTLKFLGDVDAGLVAPLSDALAAVACKTPPLRLTVSGVTAFPSTSDVRVVVAEVLKGHEDLAALVRALEDAFYDLGIAREQRPYRGHVTLARVRHAATGLATLLPPNTDCGPAGVAEVTLYRSDLLRQGAEYHALARHPLGERQ